MFHSSFYLVIFSFCADNDLNTTLVRHNASKPSKYTATTLSATPTMQHSNMHAARSSRPKSPPNHDRNFGNENTTRVVGSGYEPASRLHEALVKQQNPSAASPYSNPASSPLPYAPAANDVTPSPGSIMVPKQLSKLKRFLTTVHTFANDISPEIGDRVKNLILTLVVSGRAVNMLTLAELLSFLILLALLFTKLFHFRMA